MPVMVQPFTTATATPDMVDTPLFPTHTLRCCPTALATMVDTTEPMAVTADTATAATLMDFMADMATDGNSVI